jgi:hypothetical protein
MIKWLWSHFSTFFPFVDKDDKDDKDEDFGRFIVVDSNDPVSRARHASCLVTAVPTPTPL